MNVPIFSLPENFTVTAHSGCEGTPDNSEDSIKKAFECGADIVEFDVSFDGNNTPVLSHDTPTGGEMTADEAMIKLAGYKDLKANIDIKSTLNLAEVQLLAEKHNLLDRVFFTGISEDFVDAVKTDSPKIKYYLNIYDILPENEQSEEYIMSLIKKVKDCGAIGINMHYGNASKRMVDAFHASGLLVSLWTVNEEADMVRVLSLLPDNLTTKFPKKLLSICKKIKQEGSLI